MSTGLDRHQLTETVAQARRDLEELEMQVEAGEIDDDTADRLRATYTAELEAAEESLAALTPEDEADAPPTRSRSRMLAGAAILAVGLAVAVGLVGESTQARDDGPLQGVAAEGEFDPDQYSNETLEAVIASYEDEPELADQLQFMRFRLAERYFEEGAYDRAFPHYRTILEGEPPPELGAAALTRVAWIVWTGNGEAEIALGLLDRALEAVPGHTEATYVKGQVLWCGLSRPEEAVALFEAVLASDGLEPEVREAVTTDLEAARAGESCG